MGNGRWRCNNVQNAHAGKPANQFNSINIISLLIRPVKH